MPVKTTYKEHRRMPESEARKEWTKKNTVHISAKLQRSTDADILSYLEGKNNQTEIKKALRLLIEKEKEQAR